MREYLAACSYCTVLLLCIPAYCQRVTASLGGTVRDPSGAVVPEATVRVINTGTQVVTTESTDQKGHFLAPSLPPGQYSVVIEAKGFKKFQQTGITLDVNQTVSLDFTLEVGASTQTVQVTAEAPMLDTSDAEIGQVITSKNILNLPLNQRNPYSLILLSPGVTGSIGNSFTGLQINVNGGRSGTTDVLLDGVPSAPPTDDYKALTIFPSVDAVDEFKVQTSNYSAEFGLSGGGIINVIYKSGTNSFHGSLYEFLRNSVMDANNFFSNEKGIPLASFKRSQFGASVGGPVLIPKLYNGHNKTFFFADYEGLRQRSAAQASGTVPTAAERGGDFSNDTTSSGAHITIYNPYTTKTTSPYTRMPFPGNIIPASMINPVAANVSKYWPMPNTTGINGTQVDNWFVASVAPYDIDQGDVKVDQLISDRHRLSIRFSKRNPASYPAIYFPSSIEIAQNAATNRQNAIGGGLDYTFTATPTYLLEFRWGFARTVYQISTVSDGFDPTQLGFPSYIAETANALTFPGFEPAGYIGIGTGSQLALGSLAMQTQSWSLANTKVFSRHTLHFGAEVRALANYSNQVGRSVGDYSFATTLTQGPNALTASSTAGDGFASFLLGLGSGTVTHNFKIIDTVSQYAAGYFQDDWKATDRLTLNLGLRYEIFFPRTERHNRMTFLDLTAPSPLAGPAGLPDLKGGLGYVGVNGNSRQQNLTYYKNVSPRIGWAFQAAKNFVIRSGFGIFFQDSPNEAAATVNQTGWRSDSTFFGTINGYSPAYTLSDPFPGGNFVPVTGSSLGLLTNVGLGIAAPIRWSPTPYSENWNFDLQYQLPDNWLIDAAYVGNHGVFLTYTGQLNQLPTADLSLGPALLQNVPNPFYGLITASGPLSGKTVQLRYLLAPFPQFTGVQVVNDEGATSSYNSLQLSLQKRFSSNITLLAAFTGGKMLDDFSSNNTSNFNGDGTNQDAYNLKADWGLSTADVSKRFVGSFVYALPFGRNQRFGSHWNRFTNAILGGWQANGILTWQTGLPLALSASNVANIFNPGERPNTNGQNAGLNGSVESRLNEYFNIADFSQPATYTLGNVSRTLPNIRAPGLRNLDFSLFKNFSVTERWKIEFRAESFNMFNTPQFSAPNTSVNSPSFGVIANQANAPRQTQLALKILF